MPRTVAALTFIGGVAAIGIAVGMMPTIADGRVMEAALLEGKAPGTAAVCDRDIRIGVAGALFECTISQLDGSRARLEMKLDREGGLTYQIVDASGPTVPRLPKSADPWDY